MFEKGSLLNLLIHELSSKGMVLELMEDINNWESQIYIVVAIGNPKVKTDIFLNIKNSNVSYPTLIHPSVIILDNSTTIGKGVIITAGCVLTCNIIIEDFVILNLLCTLGHDSIISKYSSLMPAVNISGEVSVGEAVYIGTGAVINNQLSIGKNTIIGSGSIVSQSIPSDCTAVGVPAKPIKFH